MITPFTEDGVDLDSLGEMIEYQISAGTNALVILGTTGEPATMSETERSETIKYTVKKVRGRVKTIVGTGSNCTARAVASARLAEELGADGLLAVTPYYNKCTQEGLFAYYREICAAVNIPVIAYNVPSRTGVDLLPATAEKLAEIENMTGIKEASGDMVQILDTLRRTRGKMDVYSGDDALNLPVLCAGGAGVISVLSNLVPRAVRELTEAVRICDLREATSLADRLFPLARACFAEVNPIPVKEGMNLLGFRAGTPRPPLTPLGAENRLRLIDEMRAFGLGVKA